MTDLEITKLCAEAMGYTIILKGNHYKDAQGRSWPIANFDPLHDDAQAMALVKKLRLSIYESDEHEGEWDVWGGAEQRICGDGKDLNRAICECVAKMQKAKEKS